MNSDRFPDTVARLTAGQPYTENSIGMSGDRVLVFPDKVLKIGGTSDKNAATAAITRWLEGRLPVPRVLAYAQEEERDYLLMSRIPGLMACDRAYLSRPETLLPLLKEALNLLWAVDISDCPRERTLPAELREARQRLEKGLVDTEYAEKGTFGPGGFESPEKLLRWLEENKPPLEPAFSHGDCCLPNIFFSGGQVSGFIDLGDSGVADRWRDLALCYRSLKHNTDGTYGTAVPGLRPESLFDALELRPDWDKLRYYILLDEFF